MSKRLQRLARLVSVQGRMHEVAQWRLAALERQEAERVVAQHDLVDALNSEEMLFSRFANAVSRKLGRLAGEVETLKRQQQLQSRRVLDEGLRLKLTERMVSTATSQDRKEGEKRTLQDLVSRLFDPDDASLP